MASHAQSSREEQRSLSVRTLVIASVASAVAAVLTSLFWTRGTPIAAAVTPVIVALVSELLHRPAEVISQRLTTETDALPEAAGAGPPPPRQAQEGQPARDDAETAVQEGPAATAELRQATRERAAAARGATHDGANGGRPHGPPTRSTPPGVRVYGSGKRSLPWKPIALTAVLAFVIGASILTLPELIAGQSVGQGDRGTTYFGGGSRGERDRGAADEQEPTRKPKKQDPKAPPQAQPDPAPEASPPPPPEAAPRTAPEQETTTTTTPETVEETAPRPTTPTAPAPQRQPQAP